MKKSIIILGISILLVLYGCAQKGQVNNSVYPQQKGFVNDFENLLSEREEEILDSILTDFEKQTTMEIAIITIDSSMTSLDNFDNYTLGLGNYWGVGKKDQNNGILIGVSSTLRYMRIENGYGIEEILSDEETAEIINQHFIPNFKNGDYFEGMKSGTLVLMNKLISLSN